MGDLSGATLQYTQDQMFAAFAAKVAAGVPALAGHVGFSPCREPLQATGAYRGGFPGARAAPGKPVSIAGADFLRIENGKVAEYWLSSDQLDLMTQLGMTG